MRLARTLPALIAVTVLVAGCSQSGDDTASVTDTAPSEASGGAFAGDLASPDAGAPAPDGLAGGDSMASPDVERDAASATGGPVTVTDTGSVDLDAVPAADVDRKIIYTATTSNVVDDVAVAVREARDAATAQGGYVFAQDVSAGHGRVVLKVPVDRFDAVFDAVVAIGDVEAQHIDASDVTERFVDLESRQATLATSIERIRGFLAEAGNVDEISRLESELTSREAEHDVIAGQLRVLRDATSYGTITTELRLEDPETAFVTEVEQTGPPGFGAGLSSGWEAVTTAAAAAATVVGFALPFMPLLALAAAGIWWARRNRAGTPAAVTPGA